MRRSALALVVLFLAPGCGGVAQGPPLRTARMIDGQRVEGAFVSPFAYEHFIRGSLAMEANEPQEAIDHFRAALSSDEGSAYLLCWLARAQLAAGQPEAAARSVARAVRLDERSELAWVVRGEIAEVTGQPERALEAFRTAVELEPSEEAPSLELAAFHERRGERPLAAREYRRLLARAPANLEARRRLGLLLLQTGDLDRGISELERVVHSSSAERRSILALAGAQMAAGNLARASELFRVAMAEDDPHESARRGHIEALLRMGALDLATEAIERYRPAGSPGAVALERAQLLLRADQHDRAVAEADLALGFEPDLGQARLVAGLAFERTGRRDEAMRSLAAIPARAPGFAEARVAMARILVRIGEEDAARSLLQDALGAGPDGPGSEALCLALADLQLASEDAQGAEATLRLSSSSAARVAMARLWLGQGKRSQAEALLRTVVARSPEEATAARLLSRLEIDGGNARAATLRLRGIVRRDPVDARSLSLLAVVFARERRTREARQVAARAIRLAPVDAEVLANAAEVEELRGARATALAGYRRALRFGPDRDLRRRLETRIRRFAGGRPQP
ncbi:MAG: tetratricopeptide repeat protein [Deltaproteobacteria bacterium]|nr:tetratricopeptide repeat protein [Deltaproteobacteria bacterium]